MKRWTMTLAMVAMGSMASWAGSVCPAGSGANPFPHSPDSAATGCNVVITINSNGSLSVTVPDSTPYEESEDVLVGVVNNSNVQVNSINLSGSGIFGFDGDGICVYTFVGSGYCSSSAIAGTDPQDYAGPTSTFTNYTGGSSGTVNFAPGIAPGGSSYFSLEGVPSNTITGSVGSTGPVTAAAPAVSTWGLAFLVIGLAGLSFRMMKRTA